MKYSSIIGFDVANGPGIRVSLFVSGCSFHCEGCFNKEAQDFNYGYEYTDKTQAYILDRLKHPDFAGLSILGGDPMCQSKEDLSLLIDLCTQVHALGKTVWLWTGFSFDELMQKTLLNGNDETTFMHRVLLNNVDYIVDGRFELDKRDLSLAWRGSSNQHIVDVKQSLANGTLVEVV